MSDAGLRERALWRDQGCEPQTSDLSYELSLGFRQFISSFQVLVHSSYSDISVQRGAL